MKAYRAFLGWMNQKPTLGHYIVVFVLWAGVVYWIGRQY